ncbi:Arhgap25 [Columba guinea]|nr:Arhgap25 [Columba guinea]
MSLKLPRNWDFNLRMDTAKIARSKSVMSGEPAGARPGSPNPLERPLKTGWLKKQRSIVKNWQQRYFVLKGQQLYYYKDEDDAKPQGCLALLGSTVKDVASNPEEGGKFIFEIIPGVSGEQNRTGQDTCVLMANSQSEMEEWVKCIRRVLGSASGAVFGQHLAETMAYEQKFGQHQVPILVQECAEFIREHGVSEEGIFRLPGQDNLVKQLRDAFDAGERPSFDRFLHEIQLNSGVNKMSVDNLATVIGVNLVRPKIEDPAIIMRGTPQIQKVMTVMISDHAELFPASKDVPPSPPTHKNDKKTPVPRSSVGWDAAEDPAAPSTKSSIQRQMRDDLNSSSALGPAASSSAPGEDNGSKDTLGMWKTQARKRTQTLPNRKSFLTAASSGEKGSGDKSYIFARDFWKNAPGSSVRSVVPDGHKRTLSHDLFKLLDLHRASNYDNVPTSQAEGGEGGGSSPSSSGSEKEFLPCPSPRQQPKKPASPTSSTAEVSEPELESREFLQNMVLKLEKEMEVQKNDYEEQIKSLEKENYDVWAKVVRLNQDIEREKKKSEELELRLKNVERSREDMEKKNKMLEEEIKKLAKSTSKTDTKTN